ncbi:MAG: sigma-70 family RNA polymerase sigma factor [Kiritimatiellae bacterium]|jgi:RNA polymerase sigma-70 factor (ECF subfamily)|nr:sigma-70 family RNA polymerase sigma factor [Kiritimatiellia bacterium]
MDDDSEKVFHKELTAAQNDLFLYLCALTGKPDAARDVLQETNLVLCREMDRYDPERYDPERPFLVWARTVAYYQVLTWRKKQVRDRLVFDDGLLEDVVSTLKENPSYSHTQLDALEQCLSKLPERMRKLVEARYKERQAVNELAAISGRAANAISASLYRIRQLLGACIEENLGGNLYGNR